jgi:hypothetical protein
MHLQAPEAPGFGILKQLQPWRNPTKPQLPALFTQPGPNPDEVSTWSAKPFVELHFRLPPLRRDLGITVQVFPFLPDGAPVTKQDCWVHVNGLLVHFCSVSAPSEIGFTVSREIVSPRANRLSFVLPNALSPSELKLGNDLRKLALAFVKLSAAQA